MSRSNAWLYLLVLLTLRYYGWIPFDPELRGIASKALGGVALLGVIPFIWKAYPSKAMLAVLVLWSFEGTQTVLCSTLYAIKPWEVPTGQSICSVGIGLDLGAIGIMLAAILLWRLSTDKSDDTNHEEVSGK